MNLKQLYECFSNQEKQQLRTLLMTDGYDVSTVTVIEWINENREKMSPRLYNVLYANYWSRGDVFISDIDDRDLLRFRNFGQKTLAEFKQLRGH